MPKTVGQSQSIAKTASTLKNEHCSKCVVWCWASMAILFRLNGFVGGKA